jgi:hypothetical protein
MSADFREYASIRQVVQRYIGGGRQGSSETMKQAFHENASIHGRMGEDLISAPIQGLFDWVDGNPPASQVADCIASIDLRGSIASVRVELDNWGGHRFTDLLSLLKIDGEWKILCKMFHLHGE